MTLKDFMDRAGCMAHQIASSAGYTKGGFYSGASAGRGISRKRAALMASELRRIAVEFIAIAEDLTEQSARK